MQPWVVDAKDIQDLKAAEEFESHFLFRNKTIQRFINSDNKIETFIIAPKGFGKTLLLKLKRAHLQIKSPNTKFIPVDQLIDKPIGTPSIISEREIGQLLESQEYWKTLWLTALILCCLKKDEQEVDNFSSDRLISIYADKFALNPCDIFHRLVSLNRRQFFYAYRDMTNILIPRFRAIRISIAIFIDNVDEYFEQSITQSNGNKINPNLSVNYWVEAQCSLLNAARELNGINNHVKIWASIRSEAFDRIVNENPMAAQLKGSAISLRYEYEDLLEIIKSNIRSENYSNLFISANDGHEIQALFGKDARDMDNSYVAESEIIESYFLRHTLWRPRDISILGKAIAEISREGRTQAAIKEVISKTSTFIAKTYMAEMQVHVPGLRFYELLRLIDSNVLSREKLYGISEMYNNQNLHKVEDSEHNHPFCDLYRLGLLGFVKELGGNSGSIQYFPGPGEVGFAEVSVLPDAEIYLLHPVLYDIISERNSKFLSGINQINIVGRGRVWRNTDDISYVLIGDVEKYSEIMASPDLIAAYPSFNAKLIQSVRKQRSVYLSCAEGDKFTICGKNWKNVLAAAFDINQALASSIFQKRVRFGGDAGVIVYESLDLNNSKPSSGSSLRIAARLEPNVRSGTIYVTDRFIRAVQAREDELVRSFRRLESGEIPNLDYSDGKFNIAKNSSEPALLHEVFEVVREFVPGH